MLKLHDVDRPVSYTYDGASPAAILQPVTLAATKQHIRFQATTSEDALIETYIEAARATFENLACRQCVNATWEYALRTAPWERFIELPRPPLSSIVSVTYDDVDGNAQTFDAANYRVLPSFVPTEDSNPSAIDPYCRPGRIELLPTKSWPATNGEARSFRVRRVCGYGATVAAQPAIIKGLIYLLVGHLHRNRAEVADMRFVLPLGATEMLREFQRSALVTHYPHDALGHLFWGWDDFGSWPLGWS